MSQPALENEATLLAQVERSRSRATLEVYLASPGPICACNSGRMQIRTVEGGEPDALCVGCGRVILLDHAMRVRLLSALEIETARLRHVLGAGAPA